MWEVRNVIRTDPNLSECSNREVAPLLSDDHFSIDGTLVKARASMKRFQPKASDTLPDEDPGSPPRPGSPTENQLQTTEIDPMPAPPARAAIQKLTNPNLFFFLPNIRCLSRR